MKVGNEDIPQFAQLLGVERDDAISRTLLIECEEMVSYMAYYQAGYVVVTVIPLCINYEPDRACFPVRPHNKEGHGFPVGMVEAMSFHIDELNKDPDAWCKWIQLHHAKWCEDIGYDMEDD
jgi:hypothetical protein